MWFIIRDRKRYGPFTDKQLFDLFERGKINLNDLFWKNGMSNWTIGSTIFELNSLLNSKKIKTFNTPFDEAINEEKATETKDQKLIINKYKINNIFGLKILLVFICIPLLLFVSVATAFVFFKSKEKDDHFMITTNPENDGDDHLLPWNFDKRTYVLDINKPYMINITEANEVPPVDYEWEFSDSIADISYEDMSKKNSVVIRNLSVLSDAGAELLGKHRGSLSITLKNLNDFQAESLGKHVGKLSIFAERDLTEYQVSQIVNNQGELELKFSKLTDPICRELIRHKGKLSLDVGEITPSCAEIMAKHCGSLYIGCKSLTEVAAGYLATIPYNLSLGIEDLTESVASKLKNHNKILTLSWVRATEKAVEQISKKKGGLIIGFGDGLWPSMDDKISESMIKNLSSITGTLMIKNTLRIYKYNPSVIEKLVSNPNLLPIKFYGKLNEGYASALSKSIGIMELHLEVDPKTICKFPDKKKGILIVEIGFNCFKEEAASLAKLECDLVITGGDKIKNDVLEEFASRKRQLTFRGSFFLTDRRAKILAKHDGFLDLSNIRTFNYESDIFKDTMEDYLFSQKGLEMLKKKKNCYFGSRINLK